MRVRNFTPHELAVYDVRCPDGSSIMYYASEGTVRATEEDRFIVNADLDGARDPQEREELAKSGEPAILAELVSRRYTGVEGLPPTDGGDCLVVSLVAAQALWDTGQLSALTEAGVLVVTPDTGNGAVRDDKGRIIGTRRLVVQDGDHGAALARDLATTASTK